jgi:hypothetical protein
VLKHDIELTKFWLGKGGDPTIRIWDNLNTLDAAKRMYALSTLAVIDKDGVHAEFVKKVRLEFPLPTNDDFAGTWSNRQDGFGASSLTLSADGTGSIAGGVMLVPLLWKELGSDKIELAMVNPESGELIDMRMQLVYYEGAKEPTGRGRDALPRLRAGEGDQVFYRVEEEE